MMLGKKIRSIPFFSRLRTWPWATLTGKQVSADNILHGLVDDRLVGGIREDELKAQLPEEGLPEGVKVIEGKEGTRKSDAARSPEAVLPRPGDRGP